MTGPGDFGTLDELFEALTLVQTRTIKNFPVILMGGEWDGLLDWLRSGRSPRTVSPLLTYRCFIFSTILRRSRGS